ncbi:MAG: acetyl-CoA carboxylase carboxyltransferase subunit alpha [Eubacteriales bacterium]|nr:acetyl-CoA carboxylase carboxyltransferase subunit alpha [Eubacteriales bacterium]
MADLKKFFKKTVPQEEPAKAPSVPEGLWVNCPKCGEMVYKEDVSGHSYVCPKCGGYFRIKAKTRIRSVVDKDSFKEWFTGIENGNPLEYPGYPEKIQALKEKTHLDEAIRIGEATMDGVPVVIGAMDARFLMASMGYVVGEKITRAFEEASKRRLPVILFCCSGGARMQEGMVSLMQMAKTSAAIKRHSREGLLYIPVLTDPTTGGVTASFAMLGDIILAEPGALIGFAGPRVIQQTIGQKLPEGFQRSEFLVDHGIIDGIVPREQMRKVLCSLVKIHGKPCAYGNFPAEIPARTIETFGKKKKVRKSSDMTAWDRVLTARSSQRPTSLEYIYSIFDNFMELHGDRAFRDDGAVVGGIAMLDGQPVTVIGIQKGRTTKENISRNFGMPSPEGYRKALRLMKQAEKFQRAVIAFIDTPGAFCGVEAEERGQGEAIARNLMEMSDLTVPVLSIVIGEGGSGGALALGVGNEVWMMENSTYTILSPEGFASILWKDSKRAPEASEVMKVTAAQLKEMGIIERIIPEEYPAGEENLDEISEYMKIRMKKFLSAQEGKSKDEIAAQRYERFRRM